MKRLIQSSLLLATLSSAAAFAEGAPPPLTADQIRSRLEVSGEVFVFDASGKKLVATGATKNTWRGSGKAPLESNWGNSSNAYGKIYLHHVWTVQPDGSISVLIEEFAKQDDDDKRTMRDLLKKSEFTLEGFAPVNWKVQNNKEKSVYVRLTPSLRDERDVVDLKGLPIAGRNVVISDNKGYLWSDGDGSSFDGTFVGVTSHRGTIAISFQPFQGASPVGEASSNQIVLTLPNDLKVKLRSETDFVPDSVNGRVYAIYLPQKTSKHPHSTQYFTSNTAERLLERLK